MTEEKLNEISEVDEPLTISDVVSDSAFIGEMTLEAILEGISNQFADYIDMDDKRNYVELFYNQLDNSYQAIGEEDEEHPEEKRETLDRVYDQFISHITSLFDKKLAIHIVDVEDSSFGDGDLEFIILTIYEVFILNGRDNLMKVISSDLLSKINSRISSDVSDDEWYETIKDMLSGYSPIMLEITPETFLRYIKNEQLSDYYNDGKISGNFLRKYSPKLYNHEEFEIELISNITIRKDVKEELQNAAKSV